MSGLVKNRALAVLTAALLLAGLLAAFAGPAAGGQTDRPFPSSGPALVLYDESLNAAGLTERLGMKLTQDYANFGMATLTPEQRETLESNGALVEQLQDLTCVYLRNYSFDSKVGEPELPSGLTNPSSGQGWYLVQSVGPVRQEWYSQIKATGEVAGYYNNFIYLAYLSAAARDTVPTWPWVGWVGAYHPAYRLDTGLVDGKFAVSFFPNHGGSGAVTKLQQLGFTVVSSEGDEAIVEGAVTQAEEAAKLDEVVYIEQYVAPELSNNVVRTTIKADVVHNKGINGRPSNQVIAITDTGMWWPHEAFLEPGKIRAFIDIAGDSAISQGDGHGHGTHVAGSALGDAPNNGQYLSYNKWDGQAFGARAVAVKVFNNAGLWVGGGNYYNLWNLAYNQAARVNNNSWGSQTWGAYGVSSSHADRITWDRRDYVLTVAAGNSGAWGPSSVGSPATSKNAITVGATDNGTGGAPENVANFSSRGPTTDNRIKPDVMAPGNPVKSAQRGVVNGYVNMSGTSMATPQVSGSAALVREYFQRGFYPSGAAVPGDAKNPSAALVKAVLINGGKEMTGLRRDWNNEGCWPNNSQGWGRVDLDRSLYFAGDARRLLVWDSPANLATGQTWTTRFHVSDGTQEAKITLAWTDCPALPGAGRTLINDLDLWVIAPNGTVFRGNNFAGLNPGYSVAGGLFNRRDTVEGVHLVPGWSFPGNLPRGMYTVNVTARGMPMPTSNFALAVAGGVAQNPPPPVENIAVMGDYRGMLRNLLEGWGYAVLNYAGDDYASVVANISSFDVVILNNVANAVGFDNLYNAANTYQTGLIFCGSWPVWAHGMGVLQSRKGDPSTTSAYWGYGPVVTTVLAPHPVFNGYSVSQLVTLINGGDNDYQTYNGYSGQDLGDNSMSVGDPYIIGARDGGLTGARHVVLGSLGACFWTHPDHWTADGQQVMVNAIEWAGGTGVARPGRARLAMMGDYNNQIKNYLTSVGYRVTQYAQGDYAGVINNINNFDAVLLHRVDNTPGFDTLLNVAAASGRGLIFMSSWPVGSYGMGVLSSRALDPGGVNNDWSQGRVRMNVAQNHPVLSGYAIGRQLVLINGGDNDYQTYTDYNYTGTTIGTSLMPTGFNGVIGVKDRGATGGTRHVILGSFGACWYTNLIHWTPDAKQILKNAIEWAKLGAP